MGRMLLVDADVKSKEDETVKKKDRRKSRVDEENGELALDSQIRETLEDVREFLFVCRSSLHK